jgi:RHS repeat-associated protein
MTISKSNWTTVLVDTCISAYSLASAVSTTGTASSSTSGGNLVLTAPATSDMLVLTQNVVAGVSNTIQLDINRLTGANDNGVQVVIVEEINNVEYVIGSGYLHQGSKQTLTFTPTFDVAKLKIYGPFDEMLISTTCTKKAKTVQHTYLVDVCDEDGDRYRFGFNGQEKDNEIAGVGNHNTAEFWEYDTRLGRRWNVDPVDQVSISNYAVNALNPITFIDPNGDYSKVGAHLRSFFNGGRNVGYDKMLNTWTFEKGVDGGGIAYMTGLSSEERSSRRNEFKKSHFKMGDEWYKSTPNLGEIKPYEPDAMDKWAQSENLGAKMSYGLVNSFFVTGQNLFTKNFRKDDAAFNLDGTVTTVDQNVGAFADVGMSFVGGGATKYAMGPTKQWIRFGSSTKKATGQTFLSVRWGAANNRYLQIIPSTTMQNINRSVRKLGSGHWDVFEIWNKSMTDLLKKNASELFKKINTP